MNALYMPIYLAMFGERHVFALLQYVAIYSGCQFVIHAIRERQTRKHLVPGCLWQKCTNPNSYHCVL